jgi:hypothetical protein
VRVLASLFGPSEEIARDRRPIGGEGGLNPPKRDGSGHAVPVRRASQTATSQEKKNEKQMTAPNTPTKLDSQNKSTEAALAEQLAAGTQKHLSTMTQLMVDGSTITPAQAEAQLNALSALRTAVTAARTTLEAKIAAETAQLPALRVFLVAFVAFVRGTFGNSPDILADFGLLPKKATTPLTVEQKAAAAAKSKATREARGTTGKKAKLAVKGNVTGVVVTPVTTPAATPASEPVQLASSPSPAAPSPAAAPATKS